MKYVEFWLSVVGLALIALSVGGVATDPQVVVVAAVCVGLLAVLGARMDHPREAKPPAVQAAVERYITNPDAEVADLERDLDIAYSETGERCEALRRRYNGTDAPGLIVLPPRRPYRDAGGVWANPTTPVYTDSYIPDRPYPDTSVEKLR